MILGLSGSVMGSPTTPCPKTIIIAGGYSSGASIARKAAELSDRENFRLVHMPPSFDVARYYTDSFRPQDYDISLAPLPWDEQLAQLRSLSPSALIVGSEPLVDEGEAAAVALGLPSNVPELRPARVQKNLVTQSWRMGGLFVADQIVTSDVEEVIAWAQTRPKQEIVLKPLFSAGTFGVTITRSDRESIEQAFNRAKHGSYRDGHQVLAQLYIPGPEYAFDGWLQEGQVRFTDQWRYHRERVPGAATRYDWDILLPYQGEIQRKGRQYVERALKLSGLKNGAFHFELIVGDPTQIDFGTDLPFVISGVDLGARLAGAGIPDLVERATGVHPGQMLIKSAMDPNFMNTLPRSYRLHNQAAQVFITSDDGGRYSEHGLQAVYELTERFKDLYFSVHMEPLEHGAPIERTIDADTTLGRISIVGKSRARVFQAVQAIRRLRQAKAFEIIEE